MIRRATKAAKSLLASAADSGKQPASVLALEGHDDGSDHFGGLRESI